MNRLLKFFKLPLYERLIYIEAAFFLSLAWLAIRILPFRWVVLGMGRHMDSPYSKTTEQKKASTRHLISRAITTMSRHMPFQCACLAQAVACKQMLRIRNISGTVFLGLAPRNHKHGLCAHAWLLSGDQILTGGENGKTTPFIVVSYFS